MKSIFAPFALATLATMPVFSANLALTGVASQSTSPYAPSYLASNGIDGNRGNFTHTDSIPGSSWEVNLGANRFLDSFNIWNRGDGCCPERLDNVRIDVINGGGTTVWSTTIPQGSSGLFNPVQGFALPTGTIGQTLRVTNLGFNSGGNNIISVGEVEIFGSSFGTNAARLGTASMSGFGDFGGGAGIPSKGNDGIANPVFFDQSSVFHGAGGGPGQWWEVTLPKPNSIMEITGVNRGDCCAERISDIRVDIFNGASLVYTDLLTGLTNAPYFNDLPGGITGDRVRLTSLNAQDFHLAEVFVFVPEPSRGILLLGGLLGLLLPRKRKA